MCSLCVSEYVCLSVCELILAGSLYVLHAGGGLSKHVQPHPLIHTHTHCELPAAGLPPPPCGDSGRPDASSIMNEYHRRSFTFASGGAKKIFFTRTRSHYDARARARTNTHTHTHSALRMMAQVIR